MLIQFQVGNFRSFKDVATLSMVATNRTEKDKALDEENVIKVDEDLSLVRSAAIYGANASGKSNLVQAARFMRSFILNSSRETQSADPIAVEKFRLSTETEAKPSFFEMVFLLDGKKYRYGFAVTSEKVTTEWLFYVPNVREVKLFERKLNNITLGPQFKEGKELEKRTRPNALFLSVSAQFNGPISRRVLEWFRNLDINLGVDDVYDLAYANELFHSETDKATILRLIKSFDIGIHDIQSERVDPIAPALGQVTTVRTQHRKYNAEGISNDLETFDLEAHESAGTKRLFSLLLPILAALRAGTALFIDEFDARLHPILTRTIIELFNSQASNPNNAQLVFTTHDTNILNKDVFRRDQVWFVEKDRFGASHLYSLVEFKPRSDASYDKEYIKGRYGAIPFISLDPQLVLDSRNGEE